MKKIETTKDKTEFVDWYDPESLLDVTADDEKFIVEKARNFHSLNYFRLYDTIQNCYGLPHVILERTRNGTTPWLPLMITNKENTHYILSHLHNRFLTAHEAMEQVFGTLCRGLIFNIKYDVLKSWAENRFEIHEIEYIKNGKNPIQYVSNILEFDINYNEETISKLFYKHS